MIYRILSPTGDYTFGQSQNNMYVDAAEGVAQYILTRLELTVGGWFLDLSEGTDWPDILGKSDANTRDVLIQERIVQTDHVISLDDYSSSLNPTTRQLTVSASVTTDFGAASLTHTFSLTGGTVPIGNPTPTPTVIIQANQINFWTEIPTGTVNGSNATFTLVHVPNPPSSLDLFIDQGPGTAQVLLRQGVGEGYTVIGNVISFTVAPPTGSRLWAKYRY